MGNLIVGSILAVAVAAVILSMIKNKKKGKSSCGCGCASCAMSGACHKGKGEASPKSKLSAMPKNRAHKDVGKSKENPQEFCLQNSCHDRMSNACSTVLEISGMMCPMCESHINDAIRNNFKVKSVKSNHKTGITEIVSEMPLDEAKLREVIKNTGYELK